MIPAISASKIYSTLGNANSLVPLAIKDVANSAGLTAASYITGDEAEGRDRFIDEFGTQAIWLFGIPVYKKLLDWTLFKPMGFDPNIDVRILKDPEVFKKAKENAPTKEIQEALEKVGNSAKKFKGLTFGKFVASTLLTILSYYGLTKFRHKHIEEHIKEDYLKKHANELQQNKTQDKTIKAEISTKLEKVPTAFGAVHKNKTENNNKSDRNTTFTGIQDFMFSPTKNLMIVDGSITAERIFESRTPQDTVGYIVKEGSFWAFMYFLGEKIQKHFENSAEKNHDRNIQLDARVIESEEFKNALKDKDLKTTLQAFSQLKKDSDIYAFISNKLNKDNIIIKMSKMSDIISVIDKKDLNSAVDTRKYIDLAEVKGVNEKLGKVYDQFARFTEKMHKNQPAMKDDEILETFLKDLRKLKRGSIIKNIGACIGALGIVAPAIMVALRFADKDNRKFKVKEQIEKQLAQDIKNGKLVA
ncbi:hypothetical protein DBY21_05300 [Candidatus Gastranaerophilales bacterium]|nr:MAG: hypothetical protein DBY21_05300 [Candidatus Gastranaerophilales bacterium]